MKVHELGLDAETQSVAQEVDTRWPGIEFTSGYRTVHDQARAMAQNVAQRRSWIEFTYRDSTPKRALMTWMARHPEATSAAALEFGFIAVLKRFTDSELTALSLHMSKRAFDVLPQGGLGGFQKVAFLEALAKKHGGKFLKEEGGLTRWHFQMPLKTA